jgi:hypothetical protein
MELYEFYVDELNQGIVEVEAATPEEARQLAEKAYIDGETMWGNSELKFTPIAKQEIA